MNQTYIEKSSMRELFNLKLKRGDLVEIKWVDSVLTNGYAWCRVEDINWERIKSDTLHQTVGYVVKESEGLIMVTQSRRQENENYISHTTVIPQVSIKEIKKLK